VKCGAGTAYVDGQCVVPVEECEEGYHKENNSCVIDVIDTTSWFDEWQILADPAGDKTVEELELDSNGFTVDLAQDERVGITQTGVEFESGYRYELKFNYSADVAGRVIYVEVDAQGDYGFTNEETITVDGSGQFSDVIVIDETHTTTDGSIVIEIRPGDAGSVTIERIQLVKTAIQVCGTDQILREGLCVENTYGFEPNGTPTAWFTGWQILQEPVGDKSISDFNFTETGLEVYLSGGSRAGIQLTNLEFTPGYAYEVSLDYYSSESGKGVFVQLQGHGGNQITEPNLITNGQQQSYSGTLVFYPESTGTTEGWVTIEFMPLGVSGVISVSNITITEIALPTCAANEKLSGTTCVPDNNGYIPNGTPTAWFDGWSILTVPAGNKDISDYEFTDSGFTAYLDINERTGIEFQGYVFESGYTYELRFDYTTSVAGRMIWVQMEALGGYGFTNTDTWSTTGTGSFSQTLTIPNTYVPTEAGWIKIELTPGAMDNVTIENIEIIRTAN
jgi:hypothetical protein